jgi:transcriptional regulator with XRE-family HTH domain
MRALARAANCSPGHVSRVEKGERAALRPGLIVRLADALAIDPARLFSAAGILPPGIAAELSGPLLAPAVDEGGRVPHKTQWTLRRLSLAATAAAQTFAEPLQPPVQPREYAATLGFSVELDDGRPSAAFESGLITCTAPDSASKRFMIAHAIAHIVLEESPTCAFESFSQDELDATAFASFLLAPPDLLRRLVRQLAPPFNAWVEAGALLDATAKRLDAPSWLVARRIAEDGLLAEAAEVPDL